MQFFLILLPIFSIFVVGFIAQKTLTFDIANLSKMSLYVLSPFLAFKTFYAHPLTLDYLYYTLYMLGLIFIIEFFVAIWCKIMKYSIKDHCALSLSCCFMNNGNYGSPVILVFFGVAGFDLSIIIMVLSLFVVGTVGTYMAAKGSSRQTTTPNGKQAFITVLKMPIVHGALLGIIFQLLSIPLSKSIILSITMIGDASVVMIMILLGMQLARIKIRQLDLPKVSFSLLMRMVLSPLIAFALVFFMPIDYFSKQVLIILAAMPAAANTTLLAVQFDTKPELVSSIAFISTLISLITLPIVLWLVNPAMVM